jgi:hypothetical protein
MSISDVRIDNLRKLIELGLEDYISEDMKSSILNPEPFQLTEEALKLKQELEESVIFIRDSDGTVLEIRDFKNLFSNVSWPDNGKINKEDIPILRPGAQPVFRGPNPEQREGFSFYLDGIREEGGKYYLNYSYKAIT